MCHFEVSDDTYDAAQSSRWPALIPPGGSLEQRYGVGHVGGRKKRTFDHESEGAEQGLVVIVAVGKRVIDEPHSIVDQFYPVAAAFLAPAVAPDPAPVIRVPEDEPAAARSLGPRKYAHLRTVGTLHPYMHIPPVWQVRPEVLQLTQYTPVAPHAVSEVPSPQLPPLSQHPSHWGQGAAESAALSDPAPPPLSLALASVARASAAVASCPGASAMASAGCLSGLLSTFAGIPASAFAQ